MDSNLAPPLELQTLQEPIVSAVTKSECVRSQLDDQTSVEVLETPSQLIERFVEWNLLARNAVVPNAFFEPWFLMPALEMLHPQGEFRFVLLYRQPKRQTDPPQLVGFFPLERTQLPLFPGAAWTLIINPFLYSSLPLVSSDQPQKTIQSFLQWARETGISIIQMQRIPAEGLFEQALIDACGELKLMLYVQEQTTRACLKRRKDIGDYFELRGHYRRDMQRRRRRLEEQGNLQLRVLETPEDLSAWQQQFLELEANGWKGTRGTAIQQSDEQRNLFLEVTSQASQRGQLQMMGLYLDDRPLALKCNLLSGRGAYSWKIAYDEEYSKFSPGVLLEIDNIELFHHTKQLQWIDSCARATHPMINRLWPSRMTMQSVLIPTSGVISDLYCSARPLMRGVKRQFRQLIKKR